MFTFGFHWFFLNCFNLIFFFFTFLSFPKPEDSPETREEKFEALANTWRPGIDLIALTRGPLITMSVASFTQLPFLFAVRKYLKVVSFNKFMAVTSSVAMAAGASFLITNQQLDTIIRGEVNCAECHLIRTGAYQFLFSSAFPSSSAIFISILSALNNPGIPLPIDVLDRWASTKEGIKIVSRSLFKRNLLLGFAALSILNISTGIAVIYFAMKQYHDVHVALLAENSQKIVI